MSSYADFLIQAEPDTARAIGDQVFRGAGFRVEWVDPATARASRGSLTLTLLIGAMVGRKRQSMKVDIAVFAGPQPGTTVVRLTRVSTGWAAGVIGASRAKRIFADLTHELATPFSLAGTLLGVTQG